MRRRSGLLFATLLLAACRGGQSVLDPAGPQAERISDNWWVIFAITLGVYLAVMAALGVAVFHRRRRGPEQPGPIEPASRRRMSRVVGAALGLSVVLLFVSLVHSVATGRSLGSLSSPQALTIRVTGHQWWWEVRYEDPVPGRMVLTANEIHIPVGRPVLLKLTSRDVIHSLWVPNLHGKRDLIPGHHSEIWIQADRPGVYRGQCAEFCGHQHAHMALFVTAEPAEEFARWIASRNRPARPPRTAEERRGQELFLTLQCALCHNITGTPASGTVGPDLTHLASRPHLGAGMMPNTRGHLGGWVVDPQGLKPGVRMPPTSLGSGDLQALLTYLESLQ